MMDTQDSAEIAARPKVVISYEGSGKFVGLLEPLPDGRMMLVASHNAIEGPEPLVMGLADEIEYLRRLLSDLLTDCDNWGCAPSDRYAEALRGVQ